MTAAGQDPADVVRQLPKPERRILAALQAGAGDGMPLDVLAPGAGFPTEASAYSSASWLERKGLVKIDEEVQKLVELGPSGREFSRDGLPERRVYEFVCKQASHQATLTELRKAFPPDTVSIALAWWKRKGLGSIEKGEDTILRAAPQAQPQPDEELLRKLAQPSVSAPDRTEEALRRTSGQAYETLRSRPGVLNVRESKRRVLTLSPAGKVLPAQLLATETGLGELTPELIKSGAWKGKDFQTYALSTAPKREIAAKPHPLAQLIEEIREIFVQLGFQEIDEEYVVSAFWNMDALFIPQDHPAREMQDTFYLENPKSLPVPQAEFEKISKVHKTGAGTRSRGWGQALNADESGRALLRTHTTVGTIRHLARHPEPPVRVFSIGRVFRHETMDATHLPEFHQIEGIATEEGADFPMLLGILQEFYRRLGFPKLRWRPAFFPYTEPSMEVEVWTGQKWMELGGCGIFRPEVTLPFGVKTPVLAWGLGLERLAMMRFGLKDIRDLYVSDLEWLRGHPLL